MTDPAPLSGPVESREEWRPIVCPTCRSVGPCYFLDSGNAMPYFHAAKRELIEASECSGGPVDSREQPSSPAVVVQSGMEILNYGCGHRFTACPVCQRDATIERLERDLARTRCQYRGRAQESVDYADELSAALATIRELRAEAAREFESGNEWCQRALAAEAERDRARDLAAHLEAECARLQAFEVMFTRSVVGGPSYIDLLRHSTAPGAAELRADPDIAYFLAAHLEAELAERD